MASTGEARPVFTAHCARAKTTKATCSLCADACPIDAIASERDGKLAVAASCVECGICTSACPRDGISDPRGRDARLGLRIRSIRASSAVFSCERQPVAASEVVGCLAAIDPLSLLGLSGRANIVIATPDCAECPLVPGLDSWRTTLGTLVDATPHIGEKLRFAKASEFVNGGKEESISRRSLFGRLAALAGTSTASRRDSIGAAVVGGKPEAHPWIPFASIAISVDCLGCPVCEAVCPENAIERRAGPDSMRILFRQDRCTACGACADACGVQAVRLSPSLPEASSLPAELIRLEVRECIECGLEFHSNRFTCCPGCRKTS